MPSSPTNSPFTGSLPYHLASRSCQVQAQQHTQATLHERFPTLTGDDWNQIFAERRPLLWVDEQSQTVVVVEEALPRLITWATIFEACLDNTVPPIEDEGRYLARQLAYYCRLATKLVDADPKLIHHESIEDMRAVFFRLSGGNSVAERLSELPAKRGHLNATHQ